MENICGQGKRSKPRQIIISFRDGDPEDPYNWSAVSAPYLLPDKYASLKSNAAQEGIHLADRNRSCRQQHVGFIITEWCN